MKFKDMTDDKKIDTLTRKLLKELESQGKSLVGYDNILGHVDIWVHRDFIIVGNTAQKWEVRCCEYKINRGL